MHIKYLGDSYDIVKQSLLRWLTPFGPWMVHPMFTDGVTPAQVGAFARVLGVEIISSEALGWETDRERYFAAAASYGTHLFLDPDTGLCMKSPKHRPDPAYLYASELTRLALARRDRLTLVFDQSVPRGRERSHLNAKLAALGQQGLNSLAYVSHACFVLVGADGCLVATALGRIRAESGLPDERFLQCAATEQPVSEADSARRRAGPV